MYFKSLIMCDLARISRPDGRGVVAEGERADDESRGHEPDDVSGDGNALRSPSERSWSYRLRGRRPPARHGVLFQRIVQVGCCLPPVRRMLLQATHYYRTELRRKLLPVLIYRGGRSGDVCGHSLLLSETREGWPSGEQLISHDSERVDVGARVHIRISGGLLRGHVGRRSERDAVRCQCWAGCRSLGCRALEGFRNAEVENESMIARDENVLRLDIPVNDSL